MTEPNETERKIADTITLGGSSQWRRAVEALALAREGHTLEGPRSVVSGHAEIPRSVYARPGGDDAIASATVHAWRSWFAELLRRRLRPCGWPAEQRTYLAPAMLLLGQPWAVVDADDERAERLVISVSCEAVPIT